MQAALSGKSPDEALDGDRGIAVHRDSSKCCFFRHRCVGTGCRSREAAAMRASDGTFLFEIRPEPLSKRLRSFTMWKATTKQSFQRTSSCGYRKNWYADEWSIQALMAKSAPTAATTALHRLSFAANAVKCSAEFTGTIAVANPSFGAVSVDWSQPGRSATQEPSMRRY